MKTSESVKAVTVAATMLCLLGSLFGRTILAKAETKEYVSENTTTRMDSQMNIKPAVGLINSKDLEVSQKEEELDNMLVAAAVSVEQQKKEAEEARKSQIVYDGMTLDELAEKLNRTLHSTIAGQGYAFASAAVELGIDPYLAVAIVMHETGCKWECSSLLKQCNNVGGMKGSPGCNGGSYASFPSLEAGIRAYMNNLYKNYASIGLTTAESMQSKYAASTTWATKVNSYINEIKSV